MKLGTYFFVFVSLFVAAAGLVQVQSPLPSDHLRAAQRSGFSGPRVIESYGKLPLSFEANQGQSDPQVQFLSRGPGYTLFLASTEAVLRLPGRRYPSRDRQGATTKLAEGSAVPAFETAPGKLDTVLRLKLLGANLAAEVTALEQLPGKSNYFLGNDPSKWRTNVPTYAKVKYEDVYPGIDLIYYGNQQQLEYDWVVAPGADPAVIQMDIEGANPLELDRNGDLVLQAGGGQIRLNKPLIYQESEGLRQLIPGGYWLQHPHQVRFQVASYDASKPLIIDPLLIYSTYLGGIGSDQGRGIAVDASGNVYLTGFTPSVDFPTASALQGAKGGGQFDDNAFVAKLNTAGSALLYSTYLGGTTGTTEGRGIAVDASGNAYATGVARSTNFPTTPGSFQPTFGGGVSDAFVSKLNPTGSALVYSTYLGGNSDENADIGIVNLIAVDGTGNAYVTGLTRSTNFPTTVGAFRPTLIGGTDAFVTRFNTSGSALVYSTFLGGTGTDIGTGIAVDTSRNIYIFGNTNSTNFPTQSPLQSSLRGATDAFVTKLDPTGRFLFYSTYLGGSATEISASMAVDAASNAYLTGFTGSTDFPITAGAFQGTSRGGEEGFVVKLSPSGSAVYSTYLGGTGADRARGIAADPAGNAYITGLTASANFRTVSPNQPTSGGGQDAFVTLLSADGSTLLYSTYLGGNGNDGSFALAVDAIGNAYVSGFTSSPNFPATAGAVQKALGGSSDAFALKILGLPRINPGGTVNGASFAPGAALAAGSIASAFGTGIAASTVEGTSVLLDGIFAPVFSTSPEQVNFQVPWELSGRSEASLTVTAEGITSPPVAVSLAAFGPGLFSTSASGRGQGAILIANTATVAAPFGSIPGADARPANRGESISIFATGLGPVTNQPATGVAASGDPPSVTTTAPTVNIGGVPATVSFSGLSPGFFGLYQINVEVPANVPTGNALPVVLSIGGVSSNTVTIAVQ